MQSTSNTGHSFSQVPKAEIQRSGFNRSHGYKTTFDAGYLIPFFVDEVLPGDTFNLRATVFARLSTPLKPFMDNLYCDTQFFFVPYRLVWANFKKFMGEQANPGDSTSYLVPTVTGPNAAAGGIAVGHLYDYMGLPTGAGAPDLVFNNLAGRAYNLIWNEWYRDQNLQNSVTVDTGDGPDTYANYNLLKRGARHDYFTSCLPWPQKGTAVTIPLGTSAPVLGIAKVNNTYIAGPSGNVYESNGAMANYANYCNIDWATANNRFFVEENGTTGYPNIHADLTNASAATINSLRQAFQIQRLYERDARGGTRYTEIVRSHFGVISPDARLQRPEYLGGDSTPVNVNPVAQTSVAAGTPQGNLAGIGTMAKRGAGFVKSFTEHGIIIGLLSVRADLNYQQGLNRMWSRQTRWDFFWPALAHIGEQAVLNKEIYCQGSLNPTQDAAAFGYQERYAEYRYKPSVITGKFRSTYSTPLDYWHLAVNYGSLPTLGSTFIQVTPPMSRVKAVTSEPDFLLDAFFELKCARPMPTFGVPGMIDHF